MKRHQISQAITAMLADMVAREPNLTLQDLATAARVARDGIADDIAKHEHLVEILEPAFVNGCGVTPAGSAETRRILDATRTNLENARVGHELLSAVVDVLEAVATAATGAE